MKRMEIYIPFVILILVLWKYSRDKKEKLAKCGGRERHDLLDYNTSGSSVFSVT